MRKYALHPGYVCSLDRQFHFIDAYSLAFCYRVPFCECIVLDIRKPESFKGIETKNYIHLYPQDDGNYELPKKVLK